MPKHAWSLVIYMYTCQYGNSNMMLCLLILYLCTRSNFPLIRFRGFDSHNFCSFAPSIVCVTYIWIGVALVFSFAIKCRLCLFIRMVSWQISMCPTIDHLLQLPCRSKFCIQTTWWASNMSFYHTTCKQAISWKIMYAPHTHCFQGELCTTYPSNESTPFHDTCNSSFRG
jgi:hypothetical protein